MRHQQTAIVLLSAAAGAVFYVSASSLLQWIKKVISRRANYSYPARCSSSCSGFRSGELLNRYDDSSADVFCANSRRETHAFCHGLTGKTEMLTDVPENAPDTCPGVQSQHAGKTASCEGCPNKKMCLSGEARQDFNNDALLVSKNLLEVKRKLIILSGKGGVGKSSLAVQLAWILCDSGLTVGLLDVDICGPSIPKMTRSCGSDVHFSREGWEPIYVHERLAVMSIEFLLTDEDDAVIWRGPRKSALIKEFLTAVHWGSIDYLIIDTPPGTSDEHLTIITYLRAVGLDGALVVTTPQEVSLQDVRKEINFCKKTGIRVIGVVENMADSIFSQSKGNVGAMCRKMEVPYALSIPLDSSLLTACEEGCSIADINRKSNAARKFKDLMNYILDVFGDKEEVSSNMVL